VDERIVIESPENVELALEIAGLGRRFVAAIVDSILQGVLQIAIFVLTLQVYAAVIRTPELTNVAIIALIAEQFFVFVGYYIVCEMLTSGQSPGKRLAGIRVVRLNGEPISFTDSLLRNTIRIFDFLPGFYGIGIVCVFVSRESRRLGDFAAGTVVVHEARRELPQYLFVELEQTGLPEAELALIKAGVAHLAREEYEYVRHVLQRLPSLDPRTAHHVVVHTARQLMERFSISSDGADYERCFRFLTAVVAAYAQRSVAQ